MQPCNRQPHTLASPGGSGEFPVARSTQRQSASPGVPLGLDPQGPTHIGPPHAGHCRVKRRPARDAAPNVWLRSGRPPPGPDSPASDCTRPEKVRSALFGIEAHRLGEILAGGSILTLLRQHAAADHKSRRRLRVMLYRPVAVRQRRVQLLQARKDPRPVQICWGEARVYPHARRRNRPGPAPTRRACRRASRGS